MSSKIYFNDKKRTLSYYIVNMLSKAFLMISPSRAERFLRRIMVTPQKREIIQPPKSFAVKAFDTQYGSLSTYEIGNGPLVLFVHGWSGAGSQFFDLMESMSQCGYRCVAFDHYAHGESTGEESNYPLFIKGLEYIAEKFYINEDCVCVVSHSMGSSTSLNIFKQRSIPHFLIAPLFDLMKRVEEQISRTGVSLKLYKRVIAAVESDYDMNLADFLPSDAIQHIQAPLLVVHDPADKFVAFSNSEAMEKELDNMSLQAIHDVGHMRIIHADETRELLTSFLSNQN